MNESISQLLSQHHIHEVECVIPDMTGIARGKILPKDLVLSAGEMRLPKSVLLTWPLPPPWPAVIWACLRRVNPQSR